MNHLRMNHLRAHANTKDRKTETKPIGCVALHFYAKVESRLLRKMALNDSRRVTSCIIICAQIVLISREGQNELVHPSLITLSITLWRKILHVAALG